MAFWTYMLHCRGGYFCVGHTDNLERRIAEHENGSIAGFVSDHRPVTLVWSENFPTRIQALEAEKRIKGSSRAKKLALIRGDWAGVSCLAKGKGSPSTSSGRTEVTEDVSHASDLMLKENKQLRCHPETPAGRIGSISVAIRRTPAQLELTYIVNCEANALLVPQPVDPARTDELWRTTCLEVFIQTNPPAYREYNFSPSGQWAAYAFADYRQGMTPLALDRPPVIQVARAPDALRVDAIVPLDGLVDQHLALSAVIEEVDGSKSFWALRHPGGKPDFHHPDCFQLRLPAPEGP